jgi:hypothetical protein
LADVGGSMKIDQALFGYDGGHRLLASSLPLGPDAPLLTELSDVVPGAIFGNGDGYWTGLPLPSLKKYALLRTWPAPEMSRPGCVWTHALLLDPKILELFEDLSILQSMASRPKNMLDMERYKHTIEIPPTNHSASHYHSDEALISDLILKLYGQKEAIIKTAVPGELVEPLFAVWSQQWPRLRRNFKFQTALTRSAASTSSVRMDITTTLASSAEVSNVAPERPEWVCAAQQDVYDGHRGPLRSFLRKYGSDVKRQKASFRPLVQLSLLDQKSTTDVSGKVLLILEKSFPSVEDAKRLKEDLINGDLIPSAQPGLVIHILADDSTDILPTPNVNGLARIANIDPRSSVELVEIAELAIASTAPIGLAIQDLLINKISIFSQTWLLENSTSNITKFFCKNKPSLITEQTLYRLSDDDLIYALPYIANSPDSLAAIMGILLSRESKELATILFDLTPQETASAVLSRASEFGLPSNSIWITELLRRRNLLLDCDVLKSATTPDIILECVNALGWLSPEVLKAGCDPWANAIAELNPNLLSKKEEHLAAFFTALALHTGKQSGLSVVERFFDTLHSKIMNSDLNQKTVDFLLPHLASVGFFKGWDLGLRLRLSIVGAYVKYNWPRNSFLNLSHKKKTRIMLAEAATETDEGHYYADESLL